MPIHLQVKHVVVGFVVETFRPSVLTPAIPSITGTFVEGRSVLFLPVQLQRTCIHLVITKHPEDRPRIARMDNTTTNLISSEHVRTRNVPGADFGSRQDLLIDEAPARSVPCLHRLQEGIRQGLACSFVCNHEEVQYQRQPYPSHQKSL